MEDKAWPAVRLGDLVTIKHGWPFKSEYFSEYLNGRPIVVNIGNFRYTGGFRFESTTLKGYVGDYPEEFVLEPNDILLVMTCQTAGGEILGIPGRIPDDGRKYLHNQRMGKVVVTDPAKVDQGFLYWLFLSLDFNRHLAVTASGTKILHTSPDRIEAFYFHLPPSPEQSAIATVLDALDDKIELNRQMNHTLEAIARALFKSWFVDFDPVRARAEGRQPYGMDVETAVLFPDSFEDSSLGKIPVGWNIKPLSECVLYLSRGVAPSYTQISSTQVLNQRAIRWWHIDEQALKFHDSKKPVRQEAYIHKGDVVINSTGDITIGRAYWFYHEIEDLFADSHVSIIRTSSDVLLPEIVVFQVETQPHQDIIYSYVTGSTGQLELNRTNLGQIPFLCPPIELQRRFSAIIGPWFKLVWNNKEQSRILTAIRDLLLPKLLSGEIRVKDAEKFVEAAT